MANRHFGKLADVWKHLVLAEVLAAARPDRLYDTHAGHAVYAMTTDAERRYGVLNFIELAPSDATLATSSYFGLLELHRQGSEELAAYPAGPMISMLELGETCEYWFCDIDPASTANVAEMAAYLGLENRAHVVLGDGVTGVDNALAGSPDVSRVLVYVDPFDWHAVETGGLSALDLCRKAADLGAAVICWYGYDRAEQRYWLFNELCSRSPSIRWWNGDIMITRADADHTAGDLGVATSPGTGFGLTCTNVPSSALHHCDQLGSALARAYEGRPLPDGHTGALSFSRSQHET